MNSQEFIRAIRRSVRRPSIDGTLSVISEPPGRKIPTDDEELASWYNSLKDQDKLWIRSIVSTAVDGALFGMLCVIDGVRVIEDTSSKGRLQLWYIDDDEVLLNPDDGEMLHDIYNEGGED